MILLTCLMSSGCGVTEKLSDVVTSVTKTATQDEFEQVIDVVLYQQLYYDNALLEEFAQKAVLKTTAPVPGYSFTILLFKFLQESEWRSFILLG